MSIDLLSDSSPSFCHFDRSQYLMKMFLNIAFDANKNLFLIDGHAWRKLQIDISWSGSDFSLWVPLHRAKICMHHATLEVVLRHFLKSKLSPSILSRKYYLSTFQPKWNLWIWIPFFPRKLQSPRLLPVCQNRGREVSFGCFWPPEDSKLAQNYFPCIISRYFPWKIQKYKLFLIWISLAKARTRWRAHKEKKLVSWAQNFKTQKCAPNLLKFWLYLLYHMSCYTNEASTKI